MRETPSTQDRILAAAVAEFAARGFAGARVDRIAGAAHANKERIYAYFGDKETLFRKVMASLASDVSAWLPHSSHDLPRAVGALFDASFAHPALVRLLAWRRLEHPADEDEQERAAIRGKLDDIRDAQAAGAIDPSWDPADVLAMVAALAGTWANASDALTRLTEEDGRPVRDRRDVVEEAMRRILRPAHDTEGASGTSGAGRGSRPPAPRTTRRR